MQLGIIKITFHQF